MRIRAGLIQNHIAVAHISNPLRNARQKVIRLKRRLIITTCRVMLNPGSCLMVRDQFNSAITIMHIKIQDTDPSDQPLRL